MILFNYNCIKLNLRRTKLKHTFEPTCVCDHYVDASVRLMTEQAVQRCQTFYAAHTQLSWLRQQPFMIL